MPRRLHILANEQTYHVFNRTVGHEIIFTKKRELQRIIELTNYYRFPQTLRYSKFKLLPDKQKNTYLSQMEKRSPLIQLFAFAFMPNHYHFLIRQNTNRGISIFISNIQNSFAKFFNIKNERHGTVFQNPFKARRIEREEEFLHVSRYIHLNPVTSYNISISDLPSYPWTSMPSYIGKAHSSIDTSHILQKFKSGKSYFKFIADQEDYQKKLHKIKHQIME